MDTTTAFMRRANGTLEIVVNFGLVTGREATLAEVDRLGRRVCNVAGDVRVHAVRIHDMGPGSESIVNQVVVYAQATSADAETIRSICEEWAIDCANERSIEPLAL
jgi:hypothetical protein